MEKIENINELVETITASYFIKGPNGDPIQVHKSETHNKPYEVLYSVGLKNIRREKFDNQNHIKSIQIFTSHNDNHQVKEIDYYKTEFYNQRTYTNIDTESETFVDKNPAAKIVRKNKL